MKFAFILFIMMAIKGAVASEQIEQFAARSYDEAVQMAHDQNKWLFVFFQKEDCKWCRRMTSETLSNPIIQKFFATRYIVYYVNLETEPQVVRAYRRYVKGFPTYCFVSVYDPQKPLLAGIPESGYKNYNDFIGWHNKTIAKRKQ